MHFVTTAVLFASAASLTLGLLYLRVCFVGISRKANRLFVTAAFSVSIYAVCEYLLMTAATPAEYGSILRWAHVPVWFVVISTCWFVHVYFQAGRVWLLWAIAIFRTLALVANFSSPLNINYLEIRSLNRVNVLGETLSVAVGTSNPLMILGNATLVLFTIFCIDAAISLWRRGERQRALTIGLGAIVFSGTSAFFAISALWQKLPVRFRLSGKSFLVLNFKAVGVHSSVIVTELST